MSFDGILLYKLSLELKQIISYRISKIHQLSNTDLLFILRGDGKNHNLIFSISNDNARIHLSNKEYQSSFTPIGLTMFLRKHYEGNIITNLYTNLTDRVLIIETKGVNELGDRVELKIVLELMGKNSNLIFTKDNIVLESFKKYGFFDNNRTIMPNAIYELPEVTKISPIGLSVDDIDKLFKEKDINSPKDILNTFLGISPLLSNIIYNDKVPSLKLYDIINGSTTPVVYKKNDKLAFYFYNDNFEVVKEYDSLNNLIDDFYYNLASLERIKQRTNDLLLSVNRIINRLTSKIDKLNVELDTARNADEFKLYGELLLSNSYLKDYDKEHIILLNYYTNDNIKIKLDPTLSLVQNANVYYKKYQKSKTAVVHLEKQLEITKNEIKYLTLITSQIKTANLLDIEQIIEELEEERYISAKVKNKKIKNKKISLTTYLTSDNTSILVGKNNIQNEYLTHKLALGNEMWFHVKDGPGSHVVVRKTEDLNEEDIRTAAMLAAYFSPNRLSSSVPVVYTKVRYIKKIPKLRNCFVTFSNEKTIYINPEENFVMNLKVKK